MESVVLGAANGALRGRCAVCGRALSSRAAVRLRAARLVACASCGSWTYFPRGGSAGQAALHDSEEYFDHPYFALRRTVTPAQRRRCRDVFARLSDAIDPSRLRGARLLDIGCDTGAFLKAAQEEFGVVPVGVDVARRSIGIARESGIEAYQTTIEDAPAALADFPVATVIDLLEHVADPAAFLQALKARLRPGGVVYVETPNIRSAVFAFGRLLALLTRGRLGLLERLFPPQHIQLFTERSLRGLAERAGFEIVRLGTRVLPASDISASPAALLPIGALQLCDRVLGSEILLWTVLRRPAEGR
jgi:SAM-dependent methyltransferase